MVAVAEKIAIPATYTYHNGKKETVVLNATADEWVNVRQSLIDVIYGATGVVTTVNGHDVVFKKLNGMYADTDCIKMVSVHERSAWKMWMTVGDAFALAYDIERKIGR